MVEDHEKDVANSRTDFSDSEMNRGKLQDHIVSSSQQMDKDTANHNAYQQQLID